MWSSRPGAKWCSATGSPAPAAADQLLGPAAPADAAAGTGGSGPRLPRGVHRPDGRRLRAARRGGRSAVRGTGRGEQHPVHRTASSDWSERHFQLKVENTWEHNAGEIAEALNAAYEESGADLVVLAGDPRERPAVHEKLSEAVRGVTTETEHGGRAAGSASPLWRRPSRRPGDGTRVTASRRRSTVSAPAAWAPTGPRKRWKASRRWWRRPGNTASTRCSSGPTDRNWTATHGWAPDPTR
ncbi:Vms1/Ankzf1 family peptidyl-tRNA hydrolase [Streptomyces erythrogriseus]